MGFLCPFYYLGLCDSLNSFKCAGTGFRPLQFFENQGAKLGNNRFLDCDHFIRKCATGFRRAISSEDKESEELGFTQK